MYCPEEFESLIPEVKKMVELGYGRYKIADALGIKEHRARMLINIVTSVDIKVDDEIQKQKRIDLSRIKRKETREESRIIGTLEEIAKNMNQVLKNKNLSKLSICHETKECEHQSVGIIHLSDIHFNELIDIQSNKYDFNIAAKRLFLLAERAKIYFKALGVTEILIAMTGDLMNSDRRLDEMLNAASNRTKATFLAVDILQQFILDLNKDFNITVAYVSGNESRVNPEIGWNDNIVSDSYDTMIFYILKKIFEKSNGINFIEGDCSELTICINGINILMMHGHGCINGSVEKSIEQVKGRYASHGVIIDYVIFGHIHSAIVGDHFARSSSLCGSNAYNEKSLNIRGRASQNLYIIHDNKLIDGIKVDLQITNGEQYSVDYNLAEYNQKSQIKGKESKTIFQVVV
jgi:predicted phosphodiesterase/predicted nucleic-acid-binding Zn-ribbon protein